MRIACLRIPAFAARVAQLRHAALRERAVVVSGSGEARHLVVACSPEAARFGVQPGLPVRGVAALCPEAVVVPEDPVAAEAAWTASLTALTLVSPIVEAAEPGLAYLDLRGLFALHATPLDLLDAIERAVRPEWEARVGAAPGKFAAHLAAHTARPGAPCWLTPRTAPAFRHRQPVAALPVSAEMQARLARFDLRTLGELAALPRGAVLAQFGAEGGLAWDLAAGRDTARLMPWSPSEPIVETIDLADSDGLLATLLAGCAALVSRALRQPALNERLVRRLTLSATLADRRSWSTTVVLKPPSVEPERLRRALRARLEAAPPDAPVETLTLELLDLTGLAGQQPPLFRFAADGLDILPPRDDLGLYGAAAELKARYGRSPLARIVEVEPWSRLPERRYMLVDYDP